MILELDPTRTTMAAITKRKGQTPRVRPGELWIELEAEASDDYLPFTTDADTDTPPDALPPRYSRESMNLARHVKAWGGFKSNGQALRCTRWNVAMVISADHGIRAQVRAALEGIGKNG